MTETLGHTAIFLLTTAQLVLLSVISIFLSNIPTIKSHSPMLCLVFVIGDCENRFVVEVRLKAVRCICTRARLSSIPNDEECLPTLHLRATEMILALVKQTSFKGALVLVTSSL
jgi:hypothetical protein